MASVRLDDSELRALAADMTKAAESIDGKVLPIIEHGAVNIKAQMRSEMGASTHFKQIAPTIDYEVHGGDVFGVGVIEAEIGPDKAGAGGRNRGRRAGGVHFNTSDFAGGNGNAAPLANIAYFGSSRGGGTVPDPQGALDAEAPNVEKHLGDLIGGL